MKFNYLKLSIIVLTTIVLSSCSDNEEEIVDTNSTLQTEVLTNEANKVITETYKSLYDNAGMLKTKIQALTVGNTVAFTEAKNAWIATRSPWELSEGFLYGPVDTEGIDPAIDSWPVDVNAINNVLNSTSTITQSLLETNNEARGFHTVEYFLWGINGNKTANDLTPREIEYLNAAAENLYNKAQQLYNGWVTTQGNFASNFINAGQTTSIYTSKKAALQEIVEGLVIIADEVANGKIEEPLNGNNGSAKPEAEESRFSNNSKKDFADNIRSIQNIYLGDYNSYDGKGLTDIVAQSNSTLDNNIKAKITEAIAAVEAIPSTFTYSIVNDRSSVQNAQTKIQELKILLESQLTPFISNL